MSEQEPTLTPEEALLALKKQADELRISYHPSIKLATLQDKVDTELALLAETDNTPSPPTQESIVEKPKVKVETEGEKRMRLKKDAQRLIRVQITCMNPSKKDYSGEIFSAGNRLVPTIKQFIPYNAENGWHVANILLGVIRERKCQVFTTVVDAQGRKHRKGRLIPEFAIQELPPLTQEELDELAAVQAANKSLED